MPRAVVFDWYGVVVDSSARHERSWEIPAAQRGLPLPAGRFQRGFGRTNDVIIPGLGWAADPAGVKAPARQKEEICRSLVREKGTEPLPGVRRLLAALREQGIPRAIAPSTERADPDLPLDLTGLRDLFGVFLSREEVVHGKPDPAVSFARGGTAGSAARGLRRHRCRAGRHRGGQTRRHAGGRGGHDQSPRGSRPG